MGPGTRALLLTAEAGRTQAQPSRGASAYVSLLKRRPAARYEPRGVSATNRIACYGEGGARVLTRLLTLPLRAILLLPTFKQENIVFGLSASGASFPRGAVPDDAMADAGWRVPLVRWRPRLGRCRLSEAGRWPVLWFGARKDTWASSWPSCSLRRRPILQLLVLRVALCCWMWHAHCCTRRNAS